MAEEPKKPRTLFFDIEAGGLSGHHSSILSISHGVSGEPVQSIYAAPAYGTRVYSWAKKNVWEPIQSRLEAQGKRPATERTALESFLGTLESESPGGTLAGWNIGYQRIGQEIGETKSRGFDIPMLLTRARAYGLEDRYQSALGKFNIRDIGQEYAWKLANEAMQYPQHIEKDLYDQIGGYVKAGRGYQGQSGASERETAKWLATGGYKVSGWKQEVLHSTLFPDISMQAHISEEDVRAGQRLLGAVDTSIFGGDVNKVKAWQEKALRNKYVTSLRFENSPEKLADIFGRARAPVSASGAILPSIEEGLHADIKGMASSYGIEAESILRGEPIKEGFEKFFGSSNGKGINRSKFVTDVFEFSKKHKAGLGIGIAAGVLWAAKPLALFSDQKDQYDVTQDLKSFKGKETPQERFDIFRKALNVYGEEVGTGHKRILIPKSAISQKELEEQLGFIPVNVAIPEAGQDTTTSWRSTKNNLHIHSHDQEWTMHKDEHASSTMLLNKWMNKVQSGAETSILEPVTEFLKGIPHVFTEGIPGAFYYAKGQLLGGEDMAERIHKEGSSQYLAVEQKLLKSGKSSDLQKLKRLVNSRLSGKDDNHNTIEGFQHRGEAAKKRKELTDFGSGYQGDRREEREGTSLLPFGLGALGTVGGTGLALMAYNPIPGKDDAYNTIEGMKHGGLAGQTRGENTNFGSGFLRKVMAPLKNKLWTIKGKIFGFTPKWTLNQEQLKNLSTEDFYYELFRKRAITKQHLMNTQDQIVRSRIQQKAGGSLEAMLASLQENFTSPTKIIGKDDAHNIIEGLSEKGITAVLRKKDTDFGSGWRGIVALPKVLGKYFSGAGATANRLEMNQFLLEKIEGGFLKRTARSMGLGQKAYKQEIEALKSLSIDTKNSWEQMVYINPSVVAKVAKKENISYGKALRGTIEHERFHQGLRQGNLLSEMSESIKPLSIPSSFIKDISKRYKAAGTDYSPAVIGEEFIAHSITAKSIPMKINFGDTLKQTEEVRNAAKFSIEQSILQETQRTAKRSSMLTNLNRRANISLWTYGKSAGKGSTRMAGKIVQ